MTLQRRRRRNSDIFDTGPFNGYNSIGSNHDGNSSVTPAMLEDGITLYRGYYYECAEDPFGNVGWMISIYNLGAENGEYFDFTVKYFQVGFASEAAARSHAEGRIDDYSDATSDLESYNLSLPDGSGVVAAYFAGHLDYSTAADLLVALGFNNDYNSFNQAMPANVVKGMLTADTEEIAQRYQDLIDNYVPSKPMPNYESGQYQLPNVGQATAANTAIPGSSYYYWDGSLSGHTWGTHGISTGITNGKDGTTYPTPIVDSFGGYAVSLSHYIADYSNENGTFLGFRPLTASELKGGIPAGIPISTVMQFFTKPAKTRSGKDFDGFTWTGSNFYFDTEKNPIWRKAMHMPMKKENFFLLEKELAIEDKITVNTNDTWLQNTQLIDSSDAKYTSREGYSKTDDKPLSIFYPGLGSRKTLDRQFHQGKWGGLRTSSKSKIEFAAKVEWLGEDGTFSTYSEHPANIPDCNEEGKTVVTYRFPRQLDPVLDKTVLEKFAEFGMPDYSMTATRDCYPFPGTGINKKKFGLIGRLMPSESDNEDNWIKPDSNMFEAEIDGNTYATRTAINFIPMISPGFPTEKYHRPYIVSHSQGYGIATGATGGKDDYFDKTDWFCFDTDLDGARIAVTDPYKKAYFDSNRITNAYFAEGDLRVGSTAFTVGQCMLTYDIDSASYDSKMSSVPSEDFTVDLAHASERIIITTETGNLSSNNMPAGLRSDFLQPRQPRDGSAAGSLKSDYLPPVVTMTTDDLLSNIEPLGMLTIKETWKDLFGYDLTVESFSNLILGAQDKYGTTDPNDPLRYIYSNSYGTFSFPYSIAGFSVPGHFKGPVLEYNLDIGEDGQVVGDSNDNLIPLEATTERPGLIGTKSVFLHYQSPFGVTTKAEIQLDKLIQRQRVVVTIDPETGLPVAGSLDDLFQEQTGGGGVDDGNYIDTTQALQEEAQFQDWLRGRILEDHGDKRFTDTATKAYFKWWNEDYVTGQMLYDAGFPIPGVDLSSYYAEAAAAGIPIYVEETETETQDTQASGLAGFGAFTDSSGFTVTDVTSKWGALGSASPRYTGDVGMSMVPYKANVTNEQLGYLALSNLEGVETPTNISGLGGPLDDVSEGVGDGFRYGGILAGSGFAVAGIGIAGAAIMVGSVAAVNIIAARKSADKLAEKLAGKV